LPAQPRELWKLNQPNRPQTPRANVAAALTCRNSPVDGFAWIAFSLPVVAVPVTERMVASDGLSGIICGIPLSRLAIFIFTGKFSSN
jgi:hypothetical protein